MAFKSGLVLTLALTLMGGVAAVAQDHPGDHQDDPHSHYVKHDEWKKGSRIQAEDWNRGAQVDYKTHHLNAPPHGYEWREVDGNYVLAAAATGLIASVVIASASH